MSSVQLVVRGRKKIIVGVRELLLHLLEVIQRQIKQIARFLALHSELPLEKVLLLETNSKISGVISEHTPEDIYYPEVFALLYIDVFNV